MASPFVDLSRHDDEEQNRNIIHFEFITEDFLFLFFFFEIVCQIDKRSTFLRNVMLDIKHKQGITRASYDLRLDLTIYNVCLCGPILFGIRFDVHIPWRHQNNGKFFR